MIVCLKDTASNTTNQKPLCKINTLVTGKRGCKRGCTRRNSFELMQLKNGRYTSFTSK